MISEGFYFSFKIEKNKGDRDFNELYDLLCGLSGHARIQDFVWLGFHG